MSQLEQAAKAVAEVFYKYAGQDAKKNKLSTEELKALMQKEVTSLKGHDADITKMLKCLDDNKDGEIDIVEFGTLVGILANGYRK
ncbi:protein S100-B-like [Huso huso]|uniref:Protein S100-B-like n=1 Tax=Huso huso TaxID=61971 RepID=A0ABR0YFI3_HUSHU